MTSTSYLNTKGFNGSIVPRFKPWGIHPQRVEKGKMGSETHDKEMAPGKYDLSFTSCFDEKKLDKETLKSDWQRALFLEQQGKIPHFMSKYLYKEKEEQKRRMGPGKYEYTTFLEDANEHNAAVSMQSRNCRFRAINRDCFPAPGTYGKGGIADQTLYEANQRRKHCNTVGLLKRGGKSGREFFKSAYSVGPGIYKVKESIDELLQHRVGHRNRYDCDSEPRLGPIKYGHHAILPGHDLAPGSYNHKEYIEELEDRFHCFKSKFLHEAQYPKRPHERVFYMEPGNVPVDANNQVSPLSYEPRNPNYRPCESFFGKKYPFNLSSVRMDKVALANFSGNRTPYTGPGRYYTEKFDNLLHQSGATNSFKCNPMSLDTEERVKIIRERNRPRNLLTDPEKKIDHLPTEKSICVLQELEVKDHIRLH